MVTRITGDTEGESFDDEPTDDLQQGERLIRESLQLIATDSPAFEGLEDSLALQEAQLLIDRIEAGETVGLTMDQVRSQLTDVQDLVQTRKTRPGDDGKSYRDHRDEMFMNVMGLVGIYSQRGLDRLSARKAAIGTLSRLVLDRKAGSQQVPPSPQTPSTQ